MASRPVGVPFHSHYGYNLYHRHAYRHFKREQFVKRQRFDDIFRPPFDEERRPGHRGDGEFLRPTRFEDRPASSRFRPFRDDDPPFRSTPDHFFRPTPSHKPSEDFDNKPSAVADDSDSPSSESDPLLTMSTMEEDSQLMSSMPNVTYTESPSFVEPTSTPALTTETSISNTTVDVPASSTAALEDYVPESAPIDESYDTQSFADSSATNDTTILLPTPTFDALNATSTLSSSTSVSYTMTVTPHFIAVSPHQTSIARSMTSSTAFSSPSVTAHLTPVTPAQSEDGQGHHVNGAVVFFSFFGGFALLLLAGYLVLRRMRGAARANRPDEPTPIEWDFSAAAAKMYERKDDDEKSDEAAIVHLGQNPASGLLAIANTKADTRYSATTSISRYSVASSHRSSTDSDYWIDPRYPGPDSLAPMAPPGVATSNEHATNPHVVAEKDSEPIPPRPSTPHDIPLLTPQEFFSLPSSDSLHVAYAGSASEQPVTTEGAPVFGYVSVDGGLRERKDLATSRSISPTLMAEGAGSLKRESAAYMTNRRASVAPETRLGQIPESEREWL